MSIPDHVIEEIRDRAEILEVVGEVVRLKKRGRSWIGLCPFHTEKTPSFTVSPEKQMYYCFGCQAGGNVFTFVMEHERIEFPDAVRALGQRVGVEVPERADAEGPDPHAGIHFANRMAAEFYHRRLLESDDAEATRGYLSGRGVGRELWETFLLGWAPESWDALLGEATRQGVGEDALQQAGLVARSEKTPQANAAATPRSVRPRLRAHSPIRRAMGPSFASVAPLTTAPMPTECGSPPRSESFRK